MAFQTSVSQRGGQKLNTILLKAEQARIKRVRVGFFSTAKYEDGTSAAEVAATNEFGDPDRGIPERPFFRQSIAIMEDELPGVLAGVINPETMEVGVREGNLVGTHAADVVQQRIVDLKDPPNSPLTCLLYTSPSPRDRTRSRMPSSA